MSALLAVAVRCLRRQMRLTREQLAQAVGASEAVLRAVETGMMEMPEELLRALDEAFAARFRG